MTSQQMVSNALFPLPEEGLSAHGPRSVTGSWVFCRTLRRGSERRH